MTKIITNDYMQINSRKNSLFDLLSDFDKSDDDMAEIVYRDSEYKTARVLAYSLRCAIKRYRFKCIVIKRGDCICIKKI